MPKPRSPNHPGRGGFARAGWLMGLKVGIFTFLASVLITVPSETISTRIHPALALLFISLAVALGVAFDVLGIAVATAREAPFHALSSKKLAGARHSLALLRNREKVQSFCNDVVGDLSATISGSLGTALALRVVSRSVRLDEGIAVVLVAGTVAALTVGGKAGFKRLALSRSEEIVRWAGRTLEYLERVTRASLLRTDNREPGRAADVRIGKGRRTSRRIRESRANGRRHHAHAGGIGEGKGTRGPEETLQRGAGGIGGGDKGAHNSGGHEKRGPPGGQPRSR